MNRTSIKIIGESGMGLVSVGNMIARALKHKGFYVHFDREYPSLIKGGHSNIKIDFSVNPIRSLSENTDIAIALDGVAMREWVSSEKDPKVLIHGYERFEKVRGYKEKLEKTESKVLFLPARDIALGFGGSPIMANVVLIGLLWKILGFDATEMEDQLKIQFAKKPKLLEIDLKCLKSGYDPEDLTDLPTFEIDHPTEKPDTILLDGNMGIALGAIQGGCRAYYAYPMSPSSSILTYLANFAKDTGMLVKQAEDEITAIQLTIGSMHMGTRAMVGTSGGGYDLMTESVSLAGMIECPLVAIIVQRPGPATGLPTWTSQADLKMAIYSAHGEFPRVVMAMSDPASAYELTQHALNIAEKYQVPVILLSEKVIAESKTMVPTFEEGKIPIERGLVTDAKELESLESTDRYKITESGVSKRWIPGSSETYYYANGDEHQENGRLTELAQPSKEMIAKRLRKMELIKSELPEPLIFGEEKGADISFVGWGSSKAVMLDVLDELKEEGVKVNYLHYEYLYPLKTDKLEQFAKDNKNLHLIEGNHNGQLGNLIRLNSGIEIPADKRLLKWNGRPFFVEEVMDYIKNLGFRSKDSGVSRIQNPESRIQNNK